MITGISHFKRNQNCKVKKPTKQIARKKEVIKKAKSVSSRIIA
jgi:hypothetical protein